jgi:hypothetical protein
MMERRISILGPARLLVKALILFAVAGSYYAVGCLLVSGASMTEWAMVGIVTLGATSKAVSIVRQNI